MKSEPARSQPAAAFSLLELSIVTCMIGVMAGGALVLGNARIEQKRVEATRARMDVIENAIKLYAENNHRLPCPGNATLPDGHIHKGKAALNPGQCMGGTISANQISGKIAGGALPTAELGLTSEMMVDNWGRLFTYAVDIRLTAENAAIRNHNESQCGSLVMEDETGRSLVKNAIYVLLSHGTDGHGAYQTNGNIFSSGNVHPSTLINSQFDERFRTHGFFEEPQNSLNRFDDIVAFKTREQVNLRSQSKASSQYLSDSQVGSGWIHVPSTRLSNGTSVQAFDVMRYEASNPYSDNIPRSLPGQIPWANVTYNQARAACQQFGFNMHGNVTGSGSLMEYDIISESQWLALATRIAQDSRNWTESCEGEGGLMAGHHDNNPNSILTAYQTDSDGYYGTLNSAGDSTPTGHSQRRTFYLPDGSIIWDLAGNIPEWSYCDLNGFCLPYGETDRTTYTHSTIVATGDYAFTGMDTIAPPSPYNNAQFTGQLNINHLTQKNGLLRGGSYNASASSGIYQVSVGQAASRTAGFRCARHENPEPFVPVNISGLEIWYDASDIDGDGKEESTLEDGIATGSACNKHSTAKNDGCVRIWRNKAPNGRYHSRSKKLNGHSQGNEENVPTFKLHAINGKPAINFSDSSVQWLDTDHGITNDPASDNGEGFDFAGVDEMSIFIVGNAKEWNAVVSGTDNVPAWWPHFVIFPLNINYHNLNEDYVFMVDNLMDGEDTENDFCRTNGTLLGTLCLKDPIVKANYACAQMGGIHSPGGLTRNNPHIASGIFKKGSDSGLSAYVDGKAAGNGDNSVRSAEDVIAGRQCLLGGLLRSLKIKLNIGMLRTDSSVRTIGDISEIIIFSRALSAHDRMAIEAYLAGKYGLEYRYDQ